MGVEAEFQACAKNLNDSIKREMARKGAMATNTLRNVELEVLSKGGSGKKYKRLPNRSASTFYGKDETIQRFNRIRFPEFSNR